LNGDALVKFLSQSSDVEVESFFYVQKLALQVAFEKIMGKGSARDRANSRDERVIGLLGMWTGAMPDSTAITAATAAAGNSYSSMNAQDRRNTINVVAGQGFGELGVWGTRPSGINGGFYVQLQMAGERISEMQAQAVAEAGELDPLSTFHAQINPYGMMINSAYNVEMGSRVNGYNRGRLIEANILAMAKTAGSAVGAYLCGTGIGAVVGVPLLLLTNSMQINTQTGEYGTKLTDAAAIGTLVSAASAGAGGGEGLSAALSAGGSSLVASGFKYDEAGRSQGFDLTGVRGDAAAVSALAAAGAAYAGGAFNDANGLKNTMTGKFVSSVMSTGFNTLGSYANLKAYGSEYSNYASLGKADLSVGAGMLAGIYAQDLTAGLVGYRSSPIKDANKNDQSHRAATGLWGLYEGMRDRFGFGGGTGLALDSKTVQNFKDKLFYNQTRKSTDAYLASLASQGYDISELSAFVNAQRSSGVHDLSALEIAAKGKGVSADIYKQAIANASWDYESAMKSYRENNPNMPEQFVEVYSKMMQKMYMSPEAIEAKIDTYNNFRPGISKNDVGNVITVGGKEMYVVGVYGTEARVVIKGVGETKIDLSNHGLDPLTSGGLSLRDITGINERSAASQKFWFDHAQSMDMSGTTYTEYRNGMDSELLAKANYERNQAILNYNRQFLDQNLGSSGKAGGFVTGVASVIDGGIITNPVGQFFANIASRWQSKGMEWDQRQAYSLGYMSNFNNGYDSGRTAADVGMLLTGAYGLARNAMRWGGRVLIGAGDDVIRPLQHPIFNPRGLSQNCVQCNLRYLKSEAGMNTELIPSRYWNQKTINQIIGQEGPLDPRQTKALLLANGFKMQTQSFTKYSHQELLDVLGSQSNSALITRQSAQGGLSHAFSYEAGSSRFIDAQNFTGQSYMPVTPDRFNFMVYFLR